MPIFKIVAKEEIVRETVAYVEALDMDAAESWGVIADDRLFRAVDEHDGCGELVSIESVQKVSTVPSGWAIHASGDGHETEGCIA